MYAWIVEGHLIWGKTRLWNNSNKDSIGLVIEVMLIIGVAHVLATWAWNSTKDKAEVYPVKAGYSMQIVAIDILGSLPLKTIGNFYSHCSL